MHRLGKLLFPRAKHAARMRKMTVLCLTLLAALAASASIVRVWARNSGRF